MKCAICEQEVTHEHILSSKKLSWISDTVLTQSCVQTEERPVCVWCIVAIKEGKTPYSYVYLEGEEPDSEIVIKVTNDVAILERKTTHISEEVAEELTELAIQISALMRKGYKISVDPSSK